MGKKLIIFGNGLGMSINSKHFDLSNALQDVWNLPNFLDSNEKQLIQRCLNRQGCPKGEFELDSLYQAVLYCKELIKIGSGNIHWLTNDGINFPRRTSEYFHKVATRLHDSSHKLPEGFKKSIVEFVKKTKSHIATLNYDSLLYSAFIEDKVLNGFDGYLVDGFSNLGFNPENLQRKYGKDFGYYLHLHGSPLFYENNSVVFKRKRNELSIDEAGQSNHIVLTHVKRKPLVITDSSLLSTYWSYLGFCLAEADEIILFGYSGMDDHLNLLIKPYSIGKRIIIVEWDGSGNKAEREEYWNSIFNGGVMLYQLNSITDFNSWDVM